MMAQLLGASPEGDYDETDKPGMGPSPYTVVLDELAYYATSGLDRMLSQGRGLNISFMLGFQEVSGIWARLGEKTASLLGNTNTTIAMRQQDSGRTREWLEKTAGQTNVTQAVSYQGAADGAYREARHADVRTVSRVDWNDLTSLIEGEAIVLFGSRRIYARVFHAQIDGAGVKRVGRTLMLRTPERKEVIGRVKRARGVAEMIETGAVVGAAPEPVSPGLAAFVRAFSSARRERQWQFHLRPCGHRRHGRTGRERITRTPGGTVRWRADHQPATHDVHRQPAGLCRATAPGRAKRASRRQAAAGDRQHRARIRGAGSKAADDSLMTLGTRDTALADHPPVEPPPMTSEEFDRFAFVDHHPHRLATLLGGASKAA